MRTRIKVETEAFGEVKVRKLWPWEFNRFVRSGKMAFDSTNGGELIQRNNAGAAISFLSQALPLAIELIATSTGKPAVEVSKIDLDDTLTLFVAIMRLNKITLL